MDSLFQSLKTLPQGSFETLTDELVSTNYQNNSLRWSRGSRVIDNFHYYQTKTSIWSSSDELAITYAIRSVIYKKFEEILAMAQYSEVVDGVVKKYTYSEYIGGTKGDNIIYEYSWGDNWNTTVFEIEYIPYINSKLKIKREGDFRHLISAPDNATNVTTDISNFIRKSLEKNKQLGNDSLLLYARSVVKNNDYNPVYELGQFYIDETGDKYILSYLETETKNECILYKGVLTKNYSNRNIHTIINREKRYFSLPDNSQSIVRSEAMVKEYKLSLTDFYNPSILMLAKQFNILKFKAIANEDDSSVSGYIPAVTIAEKNIIAHSALFEDNVVYATRVGQKQNGGYEMECLKYTDSYGETSSIITDFRTTTGKDVDVVLMCEGINNEGEAFAGSHRSRFDFLKDSREQICLTVESIIKNDENDTNITVYEDRVANLINSEYIFVTSDQVGIRMANDSERIAFGKFNELYEQLGIEHSYPTKLEILDDSGQVCISIAQYNGEYLTLTQINSGDGSYDDGVVDPPPSDPEEPGDSEDGDTEYKIFKYSMGGLMLYSTPNTWLVSHGNVYELNTFENELNLEELIQQTDLTNYPTAVFGVIEVTFSGQIPNGSKINLEMLGVALLKLTNNSGYESTIYFTPSEVQSYQHSIEEKITSIKFFVDLGYLEGAYAKNNI